MKDNVLIEASFNPKVKAYWYFKGLITHTILISAGIGVITLPFWLIFGYWVCSRRYKYMSAQLTQRSVFLRTGFFRRVEKTVPLDKIVDLTMHTGPLLDFFGIASVQLETAGSSAQGKADMVLAGINDARGFRDAVLERRDSVVNSGAIAAPSEPTTLGHDQTVALLTEIRDLLQKISEAQAQPDRAPDDPDDA